MAQQVALSGSKTTAVAYAGILVAVADVVYKIANHQPVDFGPLMVSIVAVSGHFVAADASQPVANHETEAASIAVTPEGTK